MRQLLARHLGLNDRSAPIEMNSSLLKGHSQIPSRLTAGPPLTGKHPPRPEIRAARGRRHRPLLQIRYPAYSANRTTVLLNLAALEWFSVHRTALLLVGSD